MKVLPSMMNGNIFFYQSTQNDGPCLLDVEYLDSIDNNVDPEPISETLVHGYGQIHLIDDLDTNIIQIIPFEGLHPLSTF